MKQNFIEVSWLDSESQTGWESSDKIKSSNHLVKSYGFIVKETKDFLVIAADIDSENDHFNRFIHIPKVNIKKKRRIKI